jgi:hypothetical protein
MIQLLLGLLVVGFVNATSRAIGSESETTYLLCDSNGDLIRVKNDTGSTLVTALSTACDYVCKHFPP